MTERQKQQIERIDSYVGEILATGGDHENIMTGMYDYMGDFRELMDELPKGELDRACEDNPGLLYFAKILEMLAQGLSDGSIKADGK